MEFWNQCIELIENKEYDKLKNIIYEKVKSNNNNNNNNGIVMPIRNCFVLPENVYDVAIKNKDIKALNILLQYDYKLDIIKKDNNIRRGLDSATDGQYLKYSKYTKILDSQYYNHNILENLLRKGFKVSADLINLIIKKEGVEGTENIISFLKTVSKYEIFDNIFILNLLSYYNYKNPLSQLELNNIIHKEKKRLRNILNQKDIEGLSPLIIAVKNNNIPLLKYLIEYGADINDICSISLDVALLNNYYNHSYDYSNIQKSYDVTPLSIAYYNRNETLLEYLIDLGANINIKWKNDHGEEKTLLVLACEIGNISLVKYLIENGADVNVKVKNSETPLMAAIKYEKNRKVGNPIINYLLKQGANVNRIDHLGNTPLTLACEYDNVSLVKCLVNKGANINGMTVNNKKLKTPLITACQYNQSLIAKYLIGKGANINEQTENGDTPLLVVCQNQTKGINKYFVKYLIKCGADVNISNKNGDTPISVAMRKNDTSVIDILMKYGAEIYKNNDIENGLFFDKNEIEFNSIALILACQRGEKSLIKTLVEQGVNVNGISLKGETPLMAAINYTKRRNINNNSIINYLVEQGANVNAVDHLGNTPLTIACEYGNETVVKYLIAKGANIHGMTVNNKKWKTPLITACKYHQFHIGRYLIEEGTNVNEQIENGDTPLLIACKDKDQMDNDIFEGWVEYLMNCGADVNIKNMYGDTPLSVAIKNNNLTVKNILMEHGGKILENKDIDIPLNDVDQDSIVLISACQIGDESQVKYLVEHGANVNGRGEFGETPLIAAVNYLKDNNIFYNPIINYLVEQGANVNSYDYFGNTPLTIAYEFNNNTLINYLLEKGANIHGITINNEKWKTPLIIACKNRRRFNTFIQRGVDVNEQIENGDTPLLELCKHLMNDVDESNEIKYLVQNGADINISNKNGDTPLSFAFKSNNISLINFFIKNGAAELSESSDTSSSSFFNDEMEEDMRIPENDNNPINNPSIVGNKIDRFGSVDLASACLLGDKSEVESLVHQGANVDKIGENGYTPLICACQFGHRSLIKYLIQQGANVNKKGKGGKTPLLAAIHYENIVKTSNSIVYYLVEQGADINGMDLSWNTPLILACKYGNKSLVKYLVSKGAYIHGLTINNKKWKTPLITACQYNQSAIAKYLTKKGANVNEKIYNGDTALLVIYQKQENAIDKSLVEYLAKHGANNSAKNKNGDSPLSLAHENMGQPLVDALYYKRRYNIPIPRRIGIINFPFIPYPISSSSSSSSSSEDEDEDEDKHEDKHEHEHEHEEDDDDNISVYGHRVEYDPYNTMFLIESCKNGKDEAELKSLIEEGANVNGRKKNEETPLTAACRYGHVSIVNFLIQQGADINKNGENGETPLMAAIKYLLLLGGGRVTPEYHSFIHYLVTQGADVNGMDFYGNTPLTLACELGDKSLVKYLVDQGAQLYGRAVFNIVLKTPLITACQYGHYSIAEYLIDMGANVNETTENRDTPLLVVCKNQGVEANDMALMVSYLIHRGATVNTRNWKDETPLSVATREGNTPVIHILMNFGAMNNEQIR